MKRVKIKHKLRAEDMFKKAQYEHKIGRVTQAKHLYLKVIEINPNSEEPRTRTLSNCCLDITTVRVIRLETNG